ncbi:hypothetical protein FRC01_005476, partial [Tulasnella sp. 417]
LPNIAIGYGVAVFIDWFILFFSIRSIRNLESSSRSNAAYSSVEKGDYEHGAGVDLAHLSNLPFGQGRPHRPGSPQGGMYAQAPMYSSASLHATGGETEKLHQGSQYHLPYKP